MRTHRAANNVSPITHSTFLPARYYTKLEIRNFSLQNQILAHNTSARIIWSNQSLVLQSVTRSSAGRYVCAATNALNETRSEPLHFRVKCKFNSIVSRDMHGENIVEKSRIRNYISLHNVFCEAGNYTEIV